MSIVVYENYDSDGNTVLNKSVYEYRSFHSNASREYRVKMRIKVFVRRRNRNSDIFVRSICTEYCKTYSHHQRQMFESSQLIEADVVLRNETGHFYHHFFGDRLPVQQQLSIEIS